MKKIAVLLMLAAWLVWPHGLALAASRTGANGLEGVVPGPAPSRAATIDIPRSGQSFSSLPITVSGFCISGTLVEIYKNNVFAGSVECQGSSYKLQIDLFDGRNDLIAKEYDDLNQSGPDSAVVTVSYANPAPNIGPRVLLTSQYSKRGANPGSILTWPVTLSGGVGPYAISVDWGDKSSPDLISQPAPGNINLQHTYAQSGVYNVLIRASDAGGNTAFLQVVGLGDGPIVQNTKKTSGIITNQTTRIPWLAIILLAVLSIVAYWLGQKHQLEAIRRRLRQGEESF